MADGEVTQERWFRHLGKSAAGAAGGVVLVLAAIVLLFWNERRAARQAEALDAALRQVVPAAPAAVYPANEGKLIHVSGQAEAAETLTDATFAISVEAVKLRRIVEMYQWKQNEPTGPPEPRRRGKEAGTACTYEKVWSEKLISSALFQEPGHDNPIEMPYASVSKTGAEVRLGAFRLSPALLGQMDNYQHLPVTDATAAALPGWLSRGLRVRDGQYYRARDPRSDASTPQVGDLRVRFEVVRPGPVSVISRQVGRTFEPHTDPAGKRIDMLKVGVHTAEAMLRERIGSRAVRAWALRGVGVVVMLAGALAVLRFLAVRGAAVPLVGRMIDAGVFLVWPALAAMLCLLAIAAGWLTCRPLLALGLIVAAGAIAAGLWQWSARRGRKAAASGPDSPPPPPG